MAQRREAIVNPSLRRARRKIKRVEGGGRVPAMVVRFLRTEQIGGLILLGATALALIFANTGLRDWYGRLVNYHIGPKNLRLDLSLQHWATAGLLTIFFVVVGLELKRELVVGELRDLRKAVLPIFAAIGGMVVPALVCVLVGLGADGIGRAWAVPVATDIAFALAVLALTARALPSSLRVFLLTLAIVDDLGAILLIALGFTAKISYLPLLGGLAAIAVYAFLQQRRFKGIWLYIPLAVAAWALVQASGVHATIAGVAIGLATRVRPDPGEAHAPAETLEHTLQPISAGFCVPLFAFFAAGVALSGPALKSFVNDRVALAVVAGLVLGKTIGVLGGSVLAVRTGLAQLPKELSWRDLAAVAVLTGCGFTVSLLIAELGFEGNPQLDRIKVAVLAGSLIASLVAAMLLRRRVRARTA